MRKLGDLTIDELDEIVDDPARIWWLLRWMPRHERPAALAWIRVLREHYR
jgi:hypothetical protein